VRNQAIFNHKTTPWKSVVSMIVVGSSLSGISTNKTSNNSIRDFIILKTFNCNIHHHKPSVIQEVILWHPPLVNWMEPHKEIQVPQPVEVFLGITVLTFFIVSPSL